MISTHLKNMSHNGILPQIGMKIKHIWNHHPELQWSEKFSPSNEFVHVIFRVGCKTQPQWAVMILFVGTKKLQTQLAKDNPKSATFLISVSLLPNAHVTSLHYRYLITFSPLRFWVKSIKRMPSKRSACLFEQQRHQTYKSSVLKMDLCKDPKLFASCPKMHKLLR